jgi:CheY-like chemotaxis protein
VKVLYVEDNEDNVYMLKRRLSKFACDVLIASNGAEGVVMAQEQMPDIILMDLSLPVMDGWEATRRLKACEQTRHIPVIALTANAMAGDRDSALAAGCDDFDTKPIDFPRLLEIIRAHLSGSDW